MLLEEVRSSVALTAKREGVFIHPRIFCHLTTSSANGVGYLNLPKCHCSIWGNHFGFLNFSLSLGRVFDLLSQVEPETLS